jgi:DNA-binding transcriptional LysR family regulator
MKNNDLNQIRMFTKVAQLGSFTRAAENLGIEKSTVSTKISQLEKQLNIRLLHRTTRSVSLTDAGKQYLDYCEQALNILRQGEDYLAELNQVPKGRLRVSIPQNMLDFAMDSLVLPFLNQYPDVELEIIQSNKEVDLVADGFDIALRSSKLDLLDSSLIYREIRHSEWMMVASPDFVQRYGTAQNPEELMAQPSLGINSEVAGSQYHNQLSWQNQKVLLRHRFSINNINNIIHAAIKGLGFTMLPATMANNLIVQGKLVQIHPEIEIPASKFYLVYPNRSGQPAKMKAFVEAILEWIGQLNKS